MYQSAPSPQQIRASAAEHLTSKHGMRSSCTLLACGSAVKPTRAGAGQFGRPRSSPSPPDPDPDPRAGSTGTGSGSPGRVRLSSGSEPTSKHTTNGLESHPPQTIEKQSSSALPGSTLAQATLWIRPPWSAWLHRVLGLTFSRNVATGQENM